MNDDNRSEKGVLIGGRPEPDTEGYRAIKLVVLDVDGVLTDGRIIIDSHGVESKHFDVRDGAGISLLRFAGLHLALVTGRSSAVVDYRARELKIPPEHVKQGAKYKLAVVRQLAEELNLTFAQTAFVGDDIIDLPPMEMVALAACPFDAHADIIKASHVVMRQKGGHGAVRAFCEHLLKSKEDGSWERAVNTYLGRK